MRITWSSVTQPHTACRSLDAIREEVGDDPARWLPLFLKRTATAERRT